MFPLICLVHYHEIGLKGRNRSDFERLLRASIDRALEPFDVSSAHKISSYSVVEIFDPLKAQEIAERISRVPGVVKVSLGYKTGRSAQEYLEAARLVMSKHHDSGGTFKVRGRRSNTDFQLTSMDLNQQVGAYLCEQFPDAKVKMKNPDIQVTVHVVQGHVFVYANAFQGVGGLPVGSSGTCISLLSSGIDSPVAMWRLIKRGARVIPVHFSGRPQTADTSEYLVKDIIEQLNVGRAIPKLYVVPFGNFQKEISLSVPTSLRVIMYRRIMFQVAEQIAKRENAGALITGESLGQVASQTMHNIAAVNSAVSIPIYRPLIGHDKSEIIKEAQGLGTFEISTMQADDCCTLFMPQNPETHASEKSVNRAWGMFDHAQMVEDIMSIIEVTDFS